MQSAAPPSLKRTRLGVGVSSEADSPSPASLVSELATKYPGFVSLLTPPRARGAPVPVVSTERCRVYDGEGYASMTHDRPRNGVYREAIRRAAAAFGGGASFLEIGCGADACLTRMVLDVDARTSVFAVEANEASAAAARIALRSAGVLAERFEVLAALSTAVPTRTLRALREDRGVHVVLQEILGFIASREGIVPVFLDLQARLGRGFYAAVPSHVATFFTPTLVALGDVRHNLVHSGSMLASRGGAPLVQLPAEAGGSVRAIGSAAYLLVSRLPLHSVASFYARSEESTVPQCGALEFFDLLDDLRDKLLQRRTTLFTAPAGGTRVNSISLFIWAGCAPHITSTESSVGANSDGGTSLATPPRATRSRGPVSATTAFPYGVKGLPVLPSATLSFSSASTDQVSATNWPNVVVLLPAEIVLAEGAQLEVESITDCRVEPHTYAWRVRTFDPPPRKGRAGAAAWAPWSEWMSLDSADGVYQTRE